MAQIPRGIWVFGGAVLITLASISTLASGAQGSQSDLLSREETGISWRTMGEISSDLVRWGTSLQQLPRMVSQFVEYVSDHKLRIALIVASFLGLLIVSIYASLRLTSTLSGLLKRIEEVPPEKYTRRLGVAGLRALRGALPRIIFLGTGILFLRIAGVRGEWFGATSYVLGALAVASLLVRIVEALFSDEPELRLIPCGDGVASHLRRALKVIVGYSAVMLALIWSLEALEYRGAAIEILRLVYRAGGLILVTTLVARKHLLIELLSLPESRFKDRLGWILDRFCIFLLAFGIPILVLYNLGYFNLARFILVASSLSFVVAVAGLVAFRMMVGYMDRVLSPRDREARRVSISDDRSQKIYGALRGVAKYSIIAVAALIVLKLWGLNLEVLYGRGLEFLNFPIITIGKTPISLLSVVQVVAIVVISVLLSRYAKRSLRDHVYPHTRLDVGIQQTLSNLLGYTIIALGVIIGLTTAGINLSVVVFAGVAGIGIGFGIQNIVNNFISGLIINDGASHQGRGFRSGGGYSGKRRED
ncbi:MAG: hypothetical protein ACUVXI_14080 [bacterium]